MIGRAAGRQPEIRSLPGARAVRRGVRAARLTAAAAGAPASQQRRTLITAADLDGQRGTEVVVERVLDELHGAADRGRAGTAGAVVLDVEVVLLEVDEVDAAAVAGEGRADLGVEHALDAAHLLEQPDLVPRQRLAGARGAGRRRGGGGGAEVALGGLAQHVE